MRTVVRVFACAAAAFLGSCSPLDFEHYRSGVGTTLYTTDMAAATELQNLYLNNLCRRSSPVVAPGGDDRCNGELPPQIWPLIVQAGIGDIKQRCTAYLVWLDEKRRTNSAIVEELGIIRGAADLVINSQFGAGPRSLAALAAAFTLATGTFTKLSSFLLQVDHSTVVALVNGRQKKFEEEVASTRIDSRPAAVLVLQSYLTICMPMTIAADINITVTVFQQGGIGGLQHQTFVNSPTVGRPLTARTPLQPKIDRPTPPKNCMGNFECSISVADLKKIQGMLCVTQDGAFGAMTRDGIRAFQRARQTGAVTGQIASPRERTGLLDELTTRGACDAGLVSYFERTLFEGADAEARIGTLQKLLNNLPETGSPLSISGRLDEATRKKIAQARAILKVPPDGSPAAVTESLMKALQSKPPPPPPKQTQN